MPALGKFVSREVLAWLRGSNEDKVAFYTPEAGDLHKQFPAKSLAFERCEVDRARASWTEVCFVQFLSVARHHCFSAIQAAPQILLLASVGARQCRNSTVRPMGHVEPDGGLTQANAPHSRANMERRFDVQIWRPRRRLLDRLLRRRLPGSGRARESSSAPCPIRISEH